MMLINSPEAFFRQVKYLFEAIPERLIPLERLIYILFVCAK